jgi:uncharacterized protein YndB with AHSA1/START domain
MTMTETGRTQQTTIEADPRVPTIKIVREFDAPRERVYRAWVDPELVAQWLGPKDTPTRIDHWDLRTGGSWRYASVRGGEEIASFYGSFHEARTNERLVQTFTWAGVPDGVALETATVEDAGDGRTRVSIVSVVDSFEARDAIIASGMESGVVEGFEKLDELLADGA